ncbi:MAG: 1,6-anhydro-N-acetylmuramyl-L-alanine amidase AmpD [Gammaproteobacteria bacterium]|nr:1,6-anhydro-N-acetylmuramyl-L-alanine amidase AmpD [Gammaproteobacteria bacterium]
MPERVAPNASPPLQLTAGWCAPIRHCPSSNHDARPPGVPIDLLVIHAISLPAGHYGGPHIADLFLNQLDCAAHPSFERLRGLRVAAHFLVRRDGEMMQFVATDRRAWHAGVSVFEGRPACNDFSIGIELEGCDEDAYTDAQYRNLVRLTLLLQGAYPLLTPARIAGHSELAPGRKTDPGPHFDWARLYAGLGAEGAVGRHKLRGAE